MSHQASLHANFSQAVHETAKSLPTLSADAKSQMLVKAGIVKKSDRARVKTKLQRSIDKAK